jgi:serine/threonine-protein kinase
VDDASMTRSGVIAGTPQYMSPEQAHGDSIDHRSDLFSLGSVIHFMLSGRSPFRSETTMGVLNRIGNDQPRSLREINPDVSAWLDAIVAKLLSKDPDLRYQSSSEVAELLTSWQAHLLDPANVKAPEPTSQAKTLVSRSGIGGRFDGKLPWILAAGMFGFFAWAATVILLQTDQGTIRIESSADANVPIVIRKGDEVVEELTVTSDGASVEVKAGEYVIEIAGEADGFEVLDQSVVIQRGQTQVARVALLESDASGRPSVIERRMEGKEPPKISPFTRMDFEDGKVFVRFESNRYELLAVDHFPIGEIMRIAQMHHGRKWKKRLSEDLVEVLWGMNRVPGRSVYLQLKDPETGMSTMVLNAKMTEENRSKLYRNNEHNQPEDDTAQVEGRLFYMQPSVPRKFPRHWGGGGGTVKLDQFVPHGGRYSAMLERTDTAPQSMNLGSLWQMIDAGRFAGRRIRLSGYLKTQEADSAGLRIRISRSEGGQLKFAHVDSARLEGTSDWQEVQIVADIPEDESVLSIEVVLEGRGRLWADDLSLSIVDESAELDANGNWSRLSPEAGMIFPVSTGVNTPRNLGFELGEVTFHSG